MADDDAPNPFALLEVMVQQLALISATDQVMNHAQARERVAELRRRVADVVAATRLKLDEAEQRTQIAREIDKLIDSVAEIQNDVGKAVARTSDRLKAATRARTLGDMAQALRLISDWLGAPTDENRLRVEQLVEHIRAVTGADPFLDDAREEAKRKAEIEADVKKSLDEIFGDLKIKPPL